MNNLSPESLRWCQFDVRKADGGLNACGKSSVLNHAEGSLGNAVKFWTICVRESLCYTSLPAYVLEIPTNELSTVDRPYHVYLRRHTIHTHISRILPDGVSGIRFTLENVYRILGTG